MKLFVLNFAFQIPFKSIYDIKVDQIKMQKTRFTFMKRNVVPFCHIL